VGTQKEAEMTGLTNDQLHEHATFHREQATKLLRSLLMRAGLEVTVQNSSAIENCVEHLIAAAGYEAEVRAKDVSNV
jgi:hypothetical protein